MNQVKQKQNLWSEKIISSGESFTPEERKALLHAAFIVPPQVDPGMYNFSKLVTLPDFIDRATNVLIAHMGHCNNWLCIALAEIKKSSGNLSNFHAYLVRLNASNGTQEAQLN